MIKSSFISQSQEEGYISQKVIINLANTSSSCPLISICPTIKTLACYFFFHSWFMSQKHDRQGDSTWLVHYFLMTKSWLSNLYLIMTCSWLAHDLFPSSWGLVHDLFMTFLWLVYDWFITCSFCFMTCPCHSHNLSITVGN